jgi:hypothetical protein
MDTENRQAPENPVVPEEVPVCLRCLRPVDPRAHYCPHCGEATGQLTPLLPFESIPWQTQIWGRMYRQLWSGRVSIPGRLFRLLVIAWFAPILLLGLLFRPWHKSRRTRQP